MNRFINYVDLASEWKSALAKNGKSTNIPNWLSGSGIQYFALVLGIAIQPFFAAYQQTGIWTVEGFLGRFLFALIAGLVIFPAVYKNTLDPSKPLIVQFGAIFTAGMGWESLLATALAATGG